MRRDDLGGRLPLPLQGLEDVPQVPPELRHRTLLQHVDRLAHVPPEDGVPSLALLLHLFGFETRGEVRDELRLDDPSAAPAREALQLVADEPALKWPAEVV